LANMVLIEWMFVMIKLPLIILLVETFFMYQCGRYVLWDTGRQSPFFQGK